MSTQDGMDVLALRPYWLLPLLLCQPAAGAVTHKVTNTTVRHTPLAAWGLWRRPPMAVVTAWQPPLVLPLPASALPQNRVMSSAEYRTFLGLDNPGIAKNSECCGRAGDVPMSKIFGGSSTSQNEYPWVAALLRGGGHRAGGMPPFCAGSLLNDMYVLTAGGCVFEASEADIVVALGRHDIDGGDATEVVYGVMEIIIHPDYIEATGENNIALLKLDTSHPTLEFPTDGIAPICMPHLSRYAGLEAVAAGWGVIRGGNRRPDDLQAVDLLTISNGRCRRLLQAPALPSTMICSVSEDATPKDTCPMDDGGPLMAKTWYSEDQYTLIGVIGRSSPPCGLGPIIHTRVTPYLDWLLENMPDATYC